MVTVEHLIALVEPFRQGCKASGRKMSVTHLSAKLFNDGKRLPRILEGRSDIGSRKLAEAFQWFSDNWPHDSEWPADVPRPGMTSRADQSADADERPTPDQVANVAVHGLKIAHGVAERAISDADRAADRADRAEAKLQQIEKALGRTDGGDA